MDSEEMASKLLAGVPSVFWHNIPESHLLVARELPGVQGAEELESCFLARADFDAGVGIGGSKVGIKNFSQGHGMNLHFGSLATGIYGGEILATSGVGGAGIGGGANGGIGEWIMCIPAS